MWVFLFLCKVYIFISIKCFGNIAYVGFFFFSIMFLGKAWIFILAIYLVIGMVMVNVCLVFLLCEVPILLYILWV